MKLLDKKSLTSDANAQRKQQIDEGVRIARAVDINREELASFEKQRADFIAGSKAEMMKVIAPLVDQKEKLEHDIKKAEEDLAEKRKPLDREWAILAEDVLALHKGQEKLELDQNELSKEKERNGEDAKRNVKDRASINSDREAIGILTRDVQAKLDEAERINAETKRNAETHARRIDEEVREITRDRTQNDVDAKDLARREEVLALEKVKIENDKKWIKDRYTTLLKIDK